MTWGEKGTNALHLAAANAKDNGSHRRRSRNGKIRQRRGHHHTMNGSFATKNVPHLMIQLGADPNIVDQNGITPSSHGSKECRKDGSHPS